MAGDRVPGARHLDETPTWALAFVCAGIVLVSYHIREASSQGGRGKKWFGFAVLIQENWFRKRNKAGLYEALQKVKGELMVLGFISLLMSFMQNYIAGICIPLKYANTMLPCAPKNSYPKGKPGKNEQHRRLLMIVHRSLAGAEPSKGCKAGYVPIISLDGLHQLHIFIFFLAVFHVGYSAITMMLGRMKTRQWKEWEHECLREHDALNDPKKIRLTHEASFIREHTGLWMRSKPLYYLVCFGRQFFRSVRKTDYLTMRHGFISVHLGPGSRFDFRKYIKRSLEDDFKIVVGINPLLWAFVVLFLLVNVHGWQAMLWVSIIPLLVMLLVGTKLQAIIAQMAIEIHERYAVVQGIPLVQVSDRYFWFGWPELILHLIHFFLFQNAFELTYFFWNWYEFGVESCFHESSAMLILRAVAGIGAQFYCSYIIFPLYALVTQMGSTLKQSIFDEHTSRALRLWHKGARKRASARHHPTRTLGRSLSNFSLNSFSSNWRNLTVKTPDILSIPRSATEQAAASSSSNTDQKSSNSPASGKPRDLLT